GSSNESSIQVWLIDKSQQLNMLFSIVQNREIHGAASNYFWGCSRLANMLGYYNEDKSLQVIEERSATAS
ncbi:hypothetical protein, partial [Klebsiella pneumoniae]|uniref:hypothetical protein n=1 Tax=Klebsiella pneumoniae TaxID=573 RepID=UPI003012CAEC